MAGLSSALFLSPWRPFGGRQIELSSRSISEGAIIGDLVGNLSVKNGVGTYTFSITSDPDSKFILDVGDNSRLELEATVSYDTKTQHSVTIQATNGVNPTISRVFSINVVPVAPVLSSPSATSTGETTADLSVTTDVATGTLYWIVSQNSSTPTAAQIAAGVDSENTTPMSSGSSAVSGAGVKTINLTSLTPGITLYAYVTHYKNVYSNVASTAPFVVSDPIPTPSIAAGSTASDTTPDLDITLPAGTREGDTLRVEYSVASANTWVPYITHVLTAQDLINNTITKDGLSALSVGNYDFRARLERVTIIGSWSSTFTRAVNPAPTISSSSPADGATNVVVGTDPTITFDKNVQFGTGTIRLYDGTDTLIESWNVATEQGTSAGQVSISGATVTLNTTSNMAASTAHYIQIDSTAIQNVDGVAFAGISDKTTLNFTTGATGVPLYQGYSEGGVDSNTTLAVTLPSGVSSGDILVMIHTSNGATVPTTPSGWTREALIEVDAASDIAGAVYWKIAGSSESGFNITHASAVTQGYRMFRVANGQDVEATATGTTGSSEPNPPSLTPSWGSANNLWIAAYGHYRTPTIRTTVTYPTGYTDNQQPGVNVIPGTPTYQLSHGSATKTAIASSDDPSAYDISSTGGFWTGFTIAVRPA